MNNLIKKFVKRLNQNAPLSIDTKEFCNYKYPYKPILLIVILEHIDIDNLFNKPILIKNNESIIKIYYDI